MEAVDDNVDFELARRLQEEEIQAIQNRNQNVTEEKTRLTFFSSSF